MTLYTRFVCEYTVVQWDLAQGATSSKPWGLPQVQKSGSMGAGVVLIAMRPGDINVSPTARFPGQCGA